jgi:hypothetical protein
MDGGDFGKNCTSTNLDKTDAWLKNAFGKIVNPARFYSKILNPKPFKTISMKNLTATICLTVLVILGGA